MPGIRRRLREEHDDDGTMPPADTLEVAPVVDLRTADFFRESLVAVDPMPLEVAARGSAFMNSILNVNSFGAIDERYFSIVNSAFFIWPNAETKMKFSREEALHLF
tara:strand:- start:755 stop:1072 length:318 start_codon:yes stop_codon:yes gene_type:complete